MKRGATLVALLNIIVLIIVFQSCLSKRFSISEIAKREGVEEGFLLFEESICYGDYDSSTNFTYYVPNISGLLDSFPGKICRTGKWKEECGSDVLLYFLLNGRIFSLADSHKHAMWTTQIQNCKHYRDRIIKCKEHFVPLNALSSNYRDSLQETDFPYYYKKDKRLDTVGIIVYYPVNQ